jgi:hypothetical protein
VFGAGGTQHGIYVSNSARALDMPVVRGNTSYSNSGSGIQFNGDCGTFDHLGQSDGMISGALVENNVIHDNTGPAFSLINLSDSVLRNNVTYNTLGVASYKLADEGCNLGSNRNLIVNNTMTSATGIAGVRIVSGLGNVIFNNAIVDSGFKCVMDDTASNCTNGNEGNYYLAGIEKTPAQAGSGIFVNYAGYNFALTSGSAAIGAGVQSFGGYYAAPIDILGNARPVNGGYDAGAYQYGGTPAGTDTTPPTTPGTPAPGTSTPYKVPLTWAAATDNVQVMQYIVYRGGTAVGFAPGGQAIYTDVSVTPGASYTYTVAAMDWEQNLSAASGGLTVTVPGITGCLNSDASWRNQTIPTETGLFTMTADVTPFVASANDGVLGIGPATVTAYTGMGVLIQFGASGHIAVRNAGLYMADVTVPYALGTAYHLRAVVNAAMHTYSVYVTPAGGTEIAIATNYAFRSEQATAASLGYVATYDDSGSIAVCNLAVNGTTAANMVFATFMAAGSTTPTVVDVSQNLPGNGTFTAPAASAPGSAALTQAGTAAPAGAVTVTTVAESGVMGPSGAPATGKITITAAPAFTSAGGQRVEAVAVVPIVNGRFTVGLVPNDGSTPASQYRAVWQVNGAAQRTEAWSVKSTASVLGVKDVTATQAGMPVPLSTIFADAEVPGGTRNGTNVTFTLAHAPAPAASLILERNGVTLQEGPDYWLSGATITLVSAKVAWQATDLVASWYRYGSVTAIGFASGETPGGTIDGVNATFTLAHTPSPAAGLQLFLNGQELTQGTDYTLTGATITFTGQKVLPGDVLAAWYQYAVGQ